MYFWNDDNDVSERLVVASLCCFGFILLYLKTMQGHIMTSADTHCFDTGNETQRNSYKSMLKM